MIIGYGFTGKSPASVNRNSGEILLNEKTFDKIEKDTQDFIIEHEKGHFIEQTSDELSADAYASSNFFGTREESLKKSLKALGQFLDVDGNKNHNERYYAQLKRALAYDYAVNGNVKAFEGLKKLRASEISNFADDSENENISMTGSGGFVFGFFSTTILIIAVIIGYIYLKKQTGGLL